MRDLISSVIKKISVLFYFFLKPFKEIEKVIKIVFQAIIFIPVFVKKISPFLRLFVRML